MIAGSTPTDAYERILASGFKFRFFAFSSVINMTAAAPSLIPEAFPAVTEPASSNAVADLFPVLARRGVPTLVVAPNQDVARELRAQHPALTTIVPPYVEMDDVEGLDVIARDAWPTSCWRRGRGVVVVGLSGAKGHRLGDRLLAQSPAPPAPGPFVLMVGAAPEFHLGHIRRAPSWMQRAGLEWLYRLAHEPLRLARRYLVDDVAFAGLVWGEWRRSRREAGRVGVQDDG